MKRARRRALHLVLGGVASFAMATHAVAADRVSGTITYDGKTLTPTHVHLVRGPDAVDPSVIVRQLVFSTVDLGAAIEACKSMSCPSGELNEGMTVDIGAGPRLHYWIVRDGQRVQYSGNAKPAALAATTDEDSRIAGKLEIDDSAAGGGRISLEFDASLTKEFQSPR